MCIHVGRLPTATTLQIKTINAFYPKRLTSITRNVSKQKDSHKKDFGQTLGNNKTSPEDLLGRLNCRIINRGIETSISKKTERIVIDEDPHADEEAQNEFDNFSN